MRIKKLNLFLYSKKQMVKVLRVFGQSKVIPLWGPNVYYQNTLQAFLGTPLFFRFFGVWVFIFGKRYPSSWEILRLPIPFNTFHHHCFKCHLRLVIWPRWMNAILHYIPRRFRMCAFKWDPIAFLFTLFTRLWLLFFTPQFLKDEVSFRLTRINFDVEIEIRCREGFF